MKFMKLGSKPDAFKGDDKSVRYVTSDLVTDCTIIVGDVKFYLHKFPLLSKSKYMQKEVQKADEEKSQEIHIADFPGGSKAFEICAKFCYGMIVTLNAYNVVATRCAAEYLQMTEDIERGNLIFKIEVFLNSSIFRSWKDSIIVLQTTKSLSPWSEDLRIVGRCVESIASKTSVDPVNVTWSYTHNRKLAVEDGIIEHGLKFQDKLESVPKDWWVEDICELDIDLYKRVMIAAKSKGRMEDNVIGEALKTYVVRWLPDSVDTLASDPHSQRNKSLVETIICLLPSDKGVGCSCRFLLKLLKVSILIGADDFAREDLVERIGLTLHEASVNDLLIPARSPQSTKYDVELVQCIVNQFMVHEKAKRNMNDLVLECQSLMTVGGLVDGYLAEIANDPNLHVSSFIDLSQTIPELARPIHDGLYKAIDVYLKEHPSLTKAERKKICGLMDVKKLTREASMHAAQNERLPLRVVVQVLFFEQVRAAAGVKALGNNHNHNSTNREEWDKNDVENIKSLKKQINDLKMKEEFQKNVKLTKKNSKSSRSGAQLLPSRSKRIFDKLWAVGKGHGENRSPETSGSSQSPTSLLPGDAKSSGSSARCRRHSIS